ncbi:MAG: transglutaminase family protein [Pseudomonadota bacterium]|jgi:transglutaminase-like putative cysteine protease
MLLRILHQTRYAYEAPVVLAQHLAHLRPLTLDWQTLLEHRLEIEPEPAQLQTSQDAFGNWRSFFSLLGPHQGLLVRAHSLVQTHAADALPDSPAWEALRAQLQYRAQAPYVAAAEFVHASPFVPRHAAFATYARRFFSPGRPWLQACNALMEGIHEEFEYRSLSTAVNTPVLEAFQQRRGVCQDFAHIMIACLRSLGLPARYVSGYLLTRAPEGQARLLGADASHAWVSVPHGDAWADFDPTNRRCGLNGAGADYVSLARGRDFGDVSPLRGVIQGGGAHTLEVAVSVAPPHEFAG